MDAVFRITKIGPNGGCEGVVHDKSLVDDDDEEIPPLEGLDDDQDVGMLVGARNVILKSKM